MKPQTIGRALGIGLRVAGRMAGQRMAASAQASSSSPAPGQPQATRPSLADSARTAGKATRSLSRGIGGFLRPFGRVGGILWLEVTGVFFFLFVVVFTPFAWRTRPASIHGPYDRNFFLAIAIVVVFLYLSVTSFWRARKK